MRLWNPFCLDNTTDVSSAIYEYDTEHRAQQDKLILMIIEMNSQSSKCASKISAS